MGESDNGETGKQSASVLKETMQIDSSLGMIIKYRLRDNLVSVATFPRIMNT